VTGASQMSAVYLEHRDALFIPGARTPTEIDSAVTRAAEALATCDAWIITAGAGMGVDSGLPDFRGSTGLWKDRKVALSYEDMSDDKWFREDPAFAWGVNYTQIAMYRRTEPHAGFAVLLRWAAELAKPYYVFTSNIDSQFEKAGFPEDKVATCHGDIHHVQCTERTCRGLDKNKEDEVWNADCIPDGLDSEIDPGSLRFKDLASLEPSYFHCPRCGRLARPNVWFCHDRNYVSRQSGIRRHDSFNKFVQDIHERGRCLVVVECGGGMAIPTVRIESEDAVERAGSGSLLVRINPTDCRVPVERAVGIPFGACEGVKRIDAALQALRRKSTSRGGAATSGLLTNGRAKPGNGGASLTAAGPSQSTGRISPPTGVRRPKSNSSSTRPVVSSSATRSSLARTGAAVATPARGGLGEQVGGEESLAHVLTEFGLSLEPGLLREQLLERLRPL